MKRNFEASEKLTIRRIGPDGETSREDAVAVEEPLEIRVEGNSIAVVMRTPGHDRELALGFLYTENLVQRMDQIFDVVTCVGKEGHAGNVIDVLLRNPGEFDFEKVKRHFYSSSSCGICGTASIEQVQKRFSPIREKFSVDPDLLLTLPVRLVEAQTVFKQTGGLHACALFDVRRELVQMREDVGRHNALDKLAGYAFENGLLPLADKILFLSGRVSFEMMQKALAMGIPVVAAISAPTSLAVEFAKQNGQMLAGFIRGETLNIYTS